MTTQLAGAMKPCGCACHGGPAPVLNPRQCSEGNCDFCSGSDSNTGMVYVFGDEVRQLCEHDWRHLYEAEGISNACFKICCQCQGRGWTPAADGWVWWQASAELLNEPRSNPNQWQYFLLGWQALWCGGNDSETAFFAALIKAVEQIPGVVMG